MPQASPPHHIVTLAEADELCGAIEETLKRLDYAHLSSVYLTRRGKKHHGIAVSFDAEWRPFLGHTTGFNHKSKRDYLRASSRLLDVVRGYLLHAPRWKPGGRVFLSREAARLDSAILTTWDWSGECPVARLTPFRDSLKSERQTTARKACLDGLRTAWDKEDGGDFAAAEYHRKKAMESLVNVNLEGDFDNLKKSEDAIHGVIRELAEQNEQRIRELPGRIEQLIKEWRKTP